MATRSSPYRNSSRHCRDRYDEVLGRLTAMAFALFPRYSVSLSETLFILVTFSQMSIKFTCSACQNLLEVPDGNAGKQAKCPACSEVLVVPDVNAESSEAAKPPAPINPYAMSATSLDEPREELPEGELSVQPIDVGLSLSAGWEILKANAGVLIGSFVVMIVVSMGFGIFRAVTEEAVNAFAKPDAMVVAFIVFTFTLISQIINVWFTIGLIKIFLAVARRQPADISMLLGSSPYVVRGFLGTLLFSVALVVGFVLFIVPGIYIALTYWPFMYFIVDRDCGTIESFQLAAKHAAGNRLSAFCLGLLGICLGFLGILLFCIGWLVTTPWTLMMLAVAYLMMTGQRFYQPTA